MRRLDSAPTAIRTCQDAHKGRLGTDGSCSTFQQEEVRLRDDRLLLGADADHIHISRNVVKRKIIPLPLVGRGRGGVQPSQRPHPVFASLRHPSPQGEGKRYPRICRWPEMAGSWVSLTLDHTVPLVAGTGSRLRMGLSTAGETSSFAPKAITGS